VRGRRIAIAALNQGQSMFDATEVVARLRTVIASLIGNWLGISWKLADLDRVPMLGLACGGYWRRRAAISSSADCRWRGVGEEMGLSELG
jgi:hypothetical protein